MDHTAILIRELFEQAESYDVKLTISKPLITMGEFSYDWTYQCFEEALSQALRLFEREFTKKYLKDKISSL